MSDQEEVKKKKFNKKRKSKKVVKYIIARINNINQNLNMKEEILEFNNDKNE
jgi:hypothetical protein